MQPVFSGMPSGETCWVWPQFGLGVGSLWLKHHLEAPAPTPSFLKDLETHLVYRWARWVPDQGV